MFSVGETLKRARLEQGLDLATVAARTKINAKYLEAIESNDRKLLPSGFFYKSFVDQYASALSLDAQEIEAEVDRVLSADEPLPLPGFESVVARDVRPLKSAQRFRTRRSYASVISLVLVLAGCSAFYAWWHDARSSLSPKGIVENLLALARTGAAPSSPKLANAEVHKPALHSMSDAVVVQPAAPAAAQPEAAPVALVSDTKPDAGDEDAEAPPAARDDKSRSDKSSHDKSRDNKSSDYKVMLDLRAHEATWLSVSSDGVPVFSGTLRPNETKTVGGKQFAKLRVGNAAGLEVRLNGKLLGPLGARGQVLIVLFTPDNFEIFPAPPKESD